MSEEMPHSDAGEAGVQAERRSLTGEWTLWLLLLVPVLYVLSIGPVAWTIVHWHGAVPDRVTKAVDFVYTPVGWLHDSTPLKKPLEQYVDLWIGNGVRSGTR